MVGNDQAFIANGFISKGDIVEHQAKSKIKLLIFKDRESGKIIDGYYMATISEMPLHYKETALFTGEMYFYAKNGNFLNGWVYDNGKATLRISGSNEVEYRESINARLNTKSKPSGLSREKLMVAAPVFCYTASIPIYGTSCISVGDPPSTTCTSYIKGFNYMRYCTDLGFLTDDWGSVIVEPPVPPATEPGTPPELPTVPDEEPAQPDPCAKAKKLKENLSYKEEIRNLNEKLNLNHEVGYIKSVGSSAVFTDPGTVAKLSFPIPDPMSVPNKSLEYINHTHYNDPDALSTFGFSDIYTFARFLASGKVANINTFSIGVTTAFGTYVLVLDDWTKFGSFYKTTINNDTNFNTFFNTFNDYKTGVAEVNTGALNEKNLLKLLKDNNTGISLLKFEAATSEWEKLMIDDDGNVSKIKCPN